MMTIQLRGFYLMIANFILASGLAIAQTALPVVSQSISVADAVDMALKNNPRISSQTAMASAAEARVGMAKSMNRLRVSTTTFATTGTMPGIIAGPPAVDPPAIMATPDTRQLDQNFMAMFPIWNGGRINGQVRSAQGLSRSAQADVTTARLDVALEARTAYRRVLLAQKNVEAYQKRVDESTERVRVAQVSFDEGRIAKYDLLRTQTDLAEAQQMLVNAQRDVDLAIIDLKTALGVSLDSNLTLTDQLAPQTLSGTLGDLAARALTRRPEIQAAKARVDSAKSSVSFARSAYKPQVYAVAMQDFASVGGSSSDQGYTVGVMAGLPLVDGGQRKSATKEAEAMVRQAEADQTAAVLAVNKEVGSAWAEAQAAGKNVSLAQAAVDQADENYRVIKLRYEAGKAINVEVLDALASLTKARTSLAQAQYESNIAQDKLHRAVGDI